MLCKEAASIITYYNIIITSLLQRVLLLPIFTYFGLPNLQMKLWRKEGRSRGGEVGMIFSVFSLKRGILGWGGGWDFGVSKKCSRIATLLRGGPSPGPQIAQGPSRPAGAVKN